MSQGEKVLASKTVFRDEMEQHMSAEAVARVWKNAAAKLDQFYETYADLPKGVRMHTHNYIFPSAAIYLALKEENEILAYPIMEKTMRIKSSAMGDSLKKMSKIPGFKRMFLSLWDPVSHKMFGESSGFQNVFYPKKKNEYQMDIIACPYNKYLTELGCPELTILFCKNDEYSYGHIDGLEFRRTQTLGGGGEKCDFHMVLKD